MGGGIGDISGLFLAFCLGNLSGAEVSRLPWEIKRLNYIRNVAGVLMLAVTLLTLQQIGPFGNFVFDVGDATLLLMFSVSCSVNLSDMLSL